MLTKNIDYLRVNRRDIYEKLRSVESNLDKDIEILEAKSNALTLQKKINSKSLYIHSKYNPIDEAEKVVKQYEEQIKNSNHIIFFGAGLGYHIHMILEQYPHMTFSIFEPSSTVFYHYISNMNFHELPLKKLTNLYIQGNEATPTIYTTFSEELHRKKTLLLILPSYERIFEEEYNSFIEHVHQHVKKTSIDYKVTNNYEKRWTINSIKNLPKVLETPNIIQDIGEKPFKGKPALLVAAGPSLTEEIEHIRYIKENGLAYIFSVGSAINFLINEGIYPDAACAYDPTEKSSMVFDKVVEQNITSIPLIFGSSGGYENVARYPGPCIHMITNQDTVSSIFLKRKLESKTEVVADAPSIAVVTLQLLYRLGCSLVILVGQNLAYKDKKWYPEGLHYANSTVSKERLQEATVVNSVDGDQILTNLTFNSMRMQIEKYINLNPQTPVINTRKSLITKFFQLPHQLHE